ncbi:uncharacterized protein LOC121982188 [Zingiber officinale]|uniref:uncharacterized protein LOC121982188 n=1 Tax=Zingiber officinale TaxID=94328 RepID=UPI001C4D9B08|nr:uncharacterized protein LOC121982188 [Zingiber officinale]
MESSDSVSVENDAGIVAEDEDISVGDCLLEAIPQGSPEFEDESVGTCAMESSTQGSLHEDVHTPETELEHLFDEEEVTITTPGTFQHDKENISFRSGCLH